MPTTRDRNPQYSAASGVKHTGEALDPRIPILPSDYDVAVVSPKLMQRANESEAGAQEAKRLKREEDDE
jgi:hypothetical protein